MDLALIEAQNALKNNEVPVGAVIVKNNKIITSSHNQNLKLLDPTAHAEIIAIRNACKLLNSQRLPGCDLYVTLEPCSMCASAIAAARINNLYYILPDKKYGGVENGAKIFTQKNCHHKINIYNNIGNPDKYKLLLQSFFRDKR
tara:strand:+ start:3671 stop:4102 length:432 start_codon:yes stop_codon:yes gene_type:complete